MKLPVIKKKKSATGRICILPDECQVSPLQFYHWPIYVTTRRNHSVTETKNHYAVNW